MNKLAPIVKKAAVVGSLLILFFLIGFYYIFPGTAFQFLVAAERNLAGLTPNSVITASEPSEMLTMLKQGEAPPLIVQNRREYDDLLDFVFYERPFIPDVVKWQLARQAIKQQPLNARIWKQLEGAWDTQPLESALSGLEVPTLIIWGTKDRVLHVSGAKTLEAVMPRAQVALLKAVGHLPMVEKPEQSAGYYLRFLNSHK